jgi:hypothetical protein
MSNNDVTILHVHLSERLFRHSLRNMQLPVHHLSMFVFDRRSSLLLIHELNVSCTRRCQRRCLSIDGYRRRYLYLSAWFHWRSLVSHSIECLVDTYVFILVKSRYYRVTRIHVCSLECITIADEQRDTCFIRRLEQRRVSLRFDNVAVDMSMLWTRHRKVPLCVLFVFRVFAFDTSTCPMFRFCEILMNPCNNTIPYCFNGGTCGLDASNNPLCICPSTFTGMSHTNIFAC